MEENLCPTCSSTNVGKTEIPLKIVDNLGQTVQRDIFVCLNCGVLFVEGKISDENKQNLKLYKKLDPFRF